MNTRFRRRLTVAFTGAGFASFAFRDWLLRSFHASHPKEPRPELGFIHPLNNHGTYVFISNAESMVLALLMQIFSVCCLFVILITPKEIQLTRQGTPPNKLVATFKTDIQDPPEFWFIFLGSVTLSTIVIWFGLPIIVDRLVAHGIILLTPP
jgi:hypothetical protein